MGCRFCASTIGGLIRNLEASEMLDQIYAIERITGERVSNIVVMGTGEPLDNYDNLIRFIRIINDERGKNISQRNITVSSCGLVPQIKKLADEELSITFALSLHSPTDEDRRKLLPIANKYSIAELMEVCRSEPPYVPKGKGCGNCMMRNLIETLICNEFYCRRERYRRCRRRFYL